MQHSDAHPSKADWLVPSGLVALSVVPILAGGVRVFHLLTGDPVSTDDSRFFAAPIPVIAHVVAVSLYCLLGAFQFSRGVRRRNAGWHRAAGLVLVPSGLAAAFTGLWMTRFYAHITSDSVGLYGMRLAVGTAMIASIMMAVSAILRRDFQTHGAWMIRAYALGQGAGTQVFTHLPWFLIVGASPGPSSRAVLMAAGWLINIAVAEVIIARGNRRRIVLASMI